jgi:DNA-binding NarL/FixJ family response regulator
MVSRNGQVRVLLVDDHPIVRTGIRFTLEQDGRIRVIGESSTGYEAVRMAIDTRPDVVLMDINLPDISGLDATRRIKQQDPRIRVLVVSLYKESDYVMGMLEAGADGYLVKQCDPAELRGGVLRVHGGERVLHNSILHTVINRAVSGPATDTVTLSEREKEILLLLAEGATSKEIAVALGLQPKTVENHRSRILDKLEVVNSAAAVRTALLRGIITLQSGPDTSSALMSGSPSW